MLKVTFLMWNGFTQNSAKERFVQFNHCKIVCSKQTKLVSGWLCSFSQIYQNFFIKMKVAKVVISKKQNFDTPKTNCFVPNLTFWSEKVKLTDLLQRLCKLLRCCHKGSNLNITNWFSNNNLNCTSNRNKIECCLILCRGRWPWRWPRFPWPAVGTRETFRTWSDRFRRNSEGSCPPRRGTEGRFRFPSMKKKV